MKELDAREFSSVFINKINRLFPRHHHHNRIEMDVSATYCWIPFKSHVSINVDMYFLRVCMWVFLSHPPSLFRSVAFSSLHSCLFNVCPSSFVICNLNDYNVWKKNEKENKNESRFVENILNKNVHALLVMFFSMENVIETPKKLNLHHICFWNFIVIETRSSCLKCTRQSYFEAIIIKSTCWVDMQKVILWMHIYPSTPFFSSSHMLTFWVILSFSHSVFPSPHL